MIKIILMVLLFRILQVLCELNTPAKSYAEIIMYINDYYQCDYIFSFDDTFNISKKQWNQQIIFAKPNEKLKNMKEFEKAIKPLIVYFNNPDSTKFQLITSAVDTSKPIFCFFMNVNAKVEDFFSNMYFPYRYKFIVSQRNEMNQEKIWKVKLDNKKREIVKLLFATWSEETGIKSFTRPEEILSGHTLRAGIRHNPPLATVKRIDNELQLTGYTGTMAKSLESLLNFRFTYTFVSDIGFKENGTWNGGIGLLMNDSIDVFLFPTIFSLQRNEDVDFSFPFIMSNHAMFIKKPDDAFSWSSYFKPFEITIWFAILLTIIIESVALSVLKYYQKINVIERLRRRPIKRNLNYIEILLDVYKTTCGQGLNQSRFVPIRIFQLTIHTTALLILTFYSAVFLSIITTPEFKLPITSFKDLIENSNYKLGAIKAQVWNTIEQSDNEVMQKIYHKHLKTQNPIPASHTEGLKRMCENEKYAFVTIDYLVYAYASPSCTPVFIDHLSTVSQGIVFQHNSPYKKIFNKILLKMYESGMQKKINQEHFTLPKKIKESCSPISELQVRSIILILLIFKLLSAILLLLEIFVHRRISRRKINSF